MTYLTLYNLLSFKTSSISTPQSVELPTDSVTSNVSSLLQFTVPDGKLFYPEPFIASPSYLHADLTYLHIFQYWYWLWCMFIFLICFFFLSFLSTIRWCTTRVKPRRETRGVSRSKCGDLITACVPVSWAISIIVNESTDASDLNDGFGTGEIVVGVRAYQWGWEYYYPKAIDLNYNVRPSYSSFIGNSLKYNFSSGKNLTANSLWRMYQNKPEDRVITPAHLMLTPVDSGNTVNFLNFKNIGLNTLQESSAFAKIRNSSKVYNSLLVHTPSTLTNKYTSLNSLYLDENSYLSTSSFGLRKQHNLASTSSLGNSFLANSLDAQSFEKLLVTNIGIEPATSASEPMSAPSALSLQKSTPINSSTNTNRIPALLQTTELNKHSALSTILNYPSLLSSLNDNSDKSGIAYPATKLSSNGVTSWLHLNPNSTFTQNELGYTSSLSLNLNAWTDMNKDTNPRVFNLNGPNSKVLLGEQSIRNFPELSVNKANFTLSSDRNTAAANLVNNARVNRSSSIYANTLDLRTDYANLSTVSNLASVRSFISNSHPAVLSSSVNNTNSLDYDSTSSLTQGLRYSTNGNFEELSSSKKGSVGEVFVGSREKSPKAINSAYWSTFWSSPNAHNRVSNLLRANWDRTNFYLPTFSTYADYDFRNDQAIDMLEELFWESNYSGYNFYDYMTISKNANSQSPNSPKMLGLEKQFLTSTLGVEPLAAAKVVKDLSTLGESYSNSIQMEDYTLNPLTVQTQNFSLLTLYGDLLELDETYSNFKSVNSIFSKTATPTLGMSTNSMATRSYISVFNSFRSDFEDFTWSRVASDSPLSIDNLTSVLETNELLVSAPSKLNLSSDSDGSTFGSDTRLSNLANLRPTVRNSIVNYNAFQKVFKPRLDEGRAHVQSSSFADLSQKQPFISDDKVPYLQLLGKNRDSFFETPLYYQLPHKVINSTSALIDSLNTPMYDFPFLLARTSDTTRFTWIDWFAKWKYMEVQPSSVARYSALGAPYLRKPFDFNANTGDKFQDTESYFTRVSRSRRNYLTNWAYSPFMYNRAYVWNAKSDFESFFLNPYSTLDSAHLASKGMSWYWQSSSFIPNTTADMTYSSSGNDVYGKSTWRPKSSISSYYYNSSKLIDILSKREFLYRQFLGNKHSVVCLPKTLSATPNNPLLLELKSSFLFSDPATYSSEYSRDLLHTSPSYFKFVLFRELVQSTSNLTSALPLNASLLTDYVFFYFFGTGTNQLGQNSELYKSQFRPLKKGISNMLRLHATGAVAMPIEIRLQILASSRDVIHSWAVPSASIKIDCVPGYTSHRMMKFLLTGVYWGQCQEICGRYHHWMPIVVYFMKRDLFFLWCTHFVSAPSPNETWDISDRKFADLIRSASYDRSSWLTEFGTN